MTDLPRSLIRGDTDSFTVEVLDATNPEIAPVQVPLVNGDKVYFTIKSSVADTAIKLQKVITVFNEGKAEIFIAHEDTKDLNIKTYMYDIQISFAGGDVKTIIGPSKFTLLPEVTYE